MRPRCSERQRPDVEGAFDALHKWRFGSDFIYFVDRDSVAVGRVDVLHLAVRRVVRLDSALLPRFVWLDLSEAPLTSRNTGGL